MSINSPVGVSVSIFSLWLMRATPLAIAHRLSTLSNADRLIVLDKGRLAEFGTHAELMQKKGVYYKLVMAQRQTTKMKKVQPQTC